jgi:diguanylate cyclase (GGDEF)-like protein/PAS domain S-box-containing protein
MDKLDRAMGTLLPAAGLALAGYRLGLHHGRAARHALECEADALRAVIGRLERAERLAGIGEFVWNVDTGALWWSDNCYRLYGLDPARGITIEHAFGAIHPDDRAHAVEVTEALLSGHAPTESELRIIRPDDSVRHMLSSGELYEVDGERHVFGVTKDISELAEVRSRLVEARTHYRFLFDHSPVPMWVFDRERLTFVAVNDAMLHHYGYARDKILGRPLDMIRPADEVEAMRAAVASPDPARAQGRVWTHLRRDGARLRMALHVHDVEFDGRPARLVAAQDVTERERNEERFRLIARATSDMVYDYDVANDRLWWSDSFYTVFGYRRGEIQPSLAAFFEFVHPEDAGDVSSSFDAALASAVGEWRYEYRFRRADGSYARVAERGLIARDAGGRAVRVVGGLLDVTDARAQEADLRLLRRAVEATENGILIADACAPDQPVVYVNPAFEEITGYAAEEIHGRNCRVLQNGDRDQEGVCAIHHALRDAREVRALLRNYRKDGSLFWNEVYIAPVRDDRGALTHFVGVLNDVTERHRFEEQLAHRATHDELTGLPNRVLLEDRLQQAMYAADRAGLSSVVVFIDLDDFKLVNDSLGHGIGDLLLREIARRLLGAVRETDTVSRLGGDEFVAVLTPATADEPPAGIVERLALALARPVQLGEVAHTLTASIGYCCYPADGDDPNTLLRRADSAMYEAKRRGRNRAVAYRDEFDSTVSRKLRLITELRAALDRDEFTLVFQPQYAPDGSVCALEALVRWQHPERGLLPPAEFIAVCEESGLIVELGRRVLRDAVRCHRRLAAAGLGHIRLAVNVSAPQFTDDLYRDVTAALDGHTLPAGTLDLELTERVIMDSPAQAIELMRRLSAIGVHFSIDDFGTGYSSLAYLKRFPIQRLKIDRSFVQDLGDDPSDAAICQSIISLAHALDLQTVAEGVETEQQRDWLHERGCDELQGYFWGAPQPFEALLPHLHAARAAGPRAPPG